MVIKKKIVLLYVMVIWHLQNKWAPLDRRLSG